MYGVHLETGRLRWQTSVASEPLLIRGDRLFAAARIADRANVLRIIGFDLEDPQRSPGPSGEIVFPTWVDVADRDAFGFEAHGADEHVVIHWRAQGRYRGGAAPPAAVLRAIPQEVTGTARVHATTGAVELTSDEPGARATLQSLKLSTIRFRMGSKHCEEPWSCNDGYCGLSVADRAGAQCLILRHQAPDGNVTEAALGSWNESVIPRVTRDGKFVLAWNTQRPEGCTIFAADTGSPAASVQVDPDAEDPCIVEPKVYCIAANALIAMNLDRGDPAWSWPFPASKPKRPPPLRR
jgi:hypothetical protein